MSKPYIAVCIPSRDHCPILFAYDLVNMTVDFCSGGGNMDILISQGTVLVSQRSQLVLEARKKGATHVLWLDDDMRFPPDLITRLLAHDQLVVGANCAKRRMPTGPTAANYDPVSHNKIPLYTEPHSTGLEQVDLLGTGVLLVSMEVYDNIAMPWFATPWVVEQAGYQGEDVYFARLLKSCGVPIYVDHDLSKEIGHIGQWEYRHEHTWAAREAKQQEEAKAPEPFALAVEA